MASRCSRTLCCAIARSRFVHSSSRLSWSRSAVTLANICRAWGQGATRTRRPLCHIAALPEAGREVDDAVGECRRELTLDHLRKLTFDALLHTGDSIIERVDRFLRSLTRHDHPNNRIQKLAMNTFDVLRPFAAQLSDHGAEGIELHVAKTERLAILVVGWRGVLVQDGQGRAVAVLRVLGITVGVFLRQRRALGLALGTQPIVLAE